MPVAQNKLVPLMLSTVLVLVCHSSFAQLRIVGTIGGSVHDPSGAVIPGAKLALKDEGTGIQRQASATSEGNFVFPDLAHGLYELTVTSAGFQQMVVPHIQVVVGQTTDVPLTLRVGQTSESVVVEGGIVPVLETTSNLTGMTQNTKLVNELPANTGRWPALDVARLVPGYSNNRINNVVGGAMNTTLDGINNASNGFKSGGTVWYVAVNSRLGALDEVTVESGGLGADAGAQGAVNIKLVTKRGTNQYHGSVFYQPTSEQFNANSFSNNAQGLARTKSRVHNFGGNFGGRMVPFGYLKDRLFFFLNYEYVWTPSAGTVTTNILTDDAKRGIYKYILNGTTNQIGEVNVLTLAAAAGVPAKVDPIVQSYMDMNNTIKQYAVQVPSTALNTTAWQWNRPAPNYDYYPTARVDYYITPRHQLSFTWNVEHLWNPGTPRFPFPDSRYTGPFRKRDFLWSGALQSTLSPTMFNEFRYGRQHTGDTNASATEKYGIYNTFNGVPLRIGGTLSTLGTLTPYIDQMNTTGRHPILTMYDTFTRLQGQHTVRVGFTYRRTEWKDLSENFPFSTYTLGTPAGDPIPGNLFTTATVPGDIATDLPAGPAVLYNQLVGRVSSSAYRTVVDPDTKQFGGFVFYNWTRSRMGGVFIQDSWRIKPSLTLNYGLREDIQGDQHDVLNLSATPTLKDIYGPSVSLFTPGALSGNNDPVAQNGLQAYKPDKLNFAPNFGFAWNPKITQGLLGKVMGGSKTVIRGSYGINFYDEGTLMYSGSFGCSPGVGIGCNAGKQASQTLQAGVSTALPQFSTLSSIVAAPVVQSAYTGIPAYNTVLHQNTQTFSTSWYGMKPTLVAPYVIQWNFSVQRQLAGNLVLEVRYAGNQSHRQWKVGDLNEINIFENGFLNEFQNAQRNLAIANGVTVAQLPTATLRSTNFANTGLAGQVALPIFDAAFGPRGTVPAIAASTGYSSTTFANNLQTGAAGTLAATLTGQNYFCRMMGNSFSPCLGSGIAPTAGQSYNAPGAGYPINFFRLNPFTTTMNFADDSGWADYNGLQVQIRKTFSRGLTGTFNYTWSHSMSNTAADNANNQQNWTTWRNPSLDRRPSPFDLRHTISSFINYDLPIGSGRFLKLNSKWLDRTIGGWTASSIVTFSTGAPSQLGGNYQTVNTSVAATSTGVVLADGVTLEQISEMFHGQPLQKVNQVGNPDGRLNRAVTNDFTRLAVPLELIGSDGRANPKYLTWNTTPGYLGQTLYIYGKNSFNWNVSITKNFKVAEKIKFQLYADAQNVMNHSSWGMGNLMLFNTGFGTIGAPSGNRTMTFRGLLSF